MKQQNLSLMNDSVRPMIRNTVHNDWETIEKKTSIQ